MQQFLLSSLRRWLGNTVLESYSLQDGAQLFLFELAAQLHLAVIILFL